MPAFYRDTFTLWLCAQGRPPELYQPAGMLGAPPVGWRTQVGRSTFVYRVPEETPDTLIIVLFEREGDRGGLRSPFADIVRFLALVQRADVGILRVKGHVAATSDRPADSLENEQILAFYRRYLHVEDVALEGDVLWVGGLLKPYVPPLATHRRAASAQ